MSKPVTLVIEKSPIMSSLAMKELGMSCKIFSVKNIKNARVILHSKKINIVVLCLTGLKTREAFGDFLKKKFPNIIFIDFIDYTIKGILEMMEKLEAKNDGRR